MGRGGGGISWDDTRVSFSDANQAMSNAIGGFSAAGDIFGKIKKQIADEQQAQIENAHREKLFNENVRQFDTKLDTEQSQFNRNFDLNVEKFEEDKRKNLIGEGETYRHNTVSEGLDAFKNGTDRMNAFTDNAYKTGMIALNGLKLTQEQRKFEEDKLDKDTRKELLTTSLETRDKLDNNVKMYEALLNSPQMPDKEREQIKTSLDIARKNRREITETDLMKKFTFDFEKATGKSLPESENPFAKGAKLEQERVATRDSLMTSKDKDVIAQLANHSKNAGEFTTYSQERIDKALIEAKRKYPNLPVGIISDTIMSLPHKNSSWGFDTGKAMTNDSDKILDNFVDVRYSNEANALDEKLRVMSREYNTGKPKSENDLSSIPDANQKVESPKEAAKILKDAGFTSKDVEDRARQLAAKADNSLNALGAMAGGMTIPLEPSDPKKFLREARNELLNETDKKNKKELSAKEQREREAKLLSEHDEFRKELDSIK